MNEIIQQVKNALADSDAYEAAASTIADQLARDHHIVDHEPEYDADGFVCAYTVKDRRSGEVLARNYQLSDPWPDNWASMDAIYEEAHQTIPAIVRVDGIPASLADALIDWAQSSEEDARAWVNEMEVSA